MDFSLRRTMLMTIIAYILIPRMCSANTCTCPNGVAESGSACTTDGASMCASCSDGYTKNSAGTACEDYVKKARACVLGNNLGKFTGKTVAQCKLLCDARSDCLGFEFGVDYGGDSSGFNPGDCQLSGPSVDTDGCDGSYWNSDFYTKTTATIECSEVYKGPKWTFGIIEWTLPLTLNITTSGGASDCETATAISWAIIIAIICVLVVGVCCCCCCCCCCSCCRGGTRREIRERPVESAPREVHIHHYHEAGYDDGHERPPEKPNIDKPITPLATYIVPESDTCIS